MHDTKPREVATSLATTPNGIITALSAFRFKASCERAEPIRICVCKYIFRRVQIAFGYSEGRAFTTLLFHISFREEKPSQ